MRVRIAALAIAALAVPTLAACSAADLLVQSFEVGQCVDFDVAPGDEETEVGDLPIIDCNEPHDGEVYYVMDLDGGDYPSDVSTQADNACLAEFAPYVGVDYFESELFYTSVYPSNSTWTLGDRQIACIVVPASGQLSESVQGSGR